MSKERLSSTDDSNCDLAMESILPPFRLAGGTSGFLRAPAVSRNPELEASELKDRLLRIDARMELRRSNLCSARCLDLLAQKATHRITSSKAAAEAPKRATVRASSVHPSGSNTT